MNLYKDYTQDEKLALIRIIRYMLIRLKNSKQQFWDSAVVTTRIHVPAVIDYLLCVWADNYQVINNVDYDVLDKLPVEPFINHIKCFNSDKRQGVAIVLYYLTYGIMPNPDNCSVAILSDLKMQCQLANPPTLLYEKYGKEFISHMNTVYKMRNKED